MKEKIEAFLAALREKLLIKQNKPALARDLQEPEVFAEEISHSIGSDTQKITFKTK